MFSPLWTPCVRVGFACTDLGSGGLQNIYTYTRVGKKWEKWEKWDNWKSGTSGRKEGKMGQVGKVVKK